MGLTERHWFEEEDALNERQLEDEVEYGEKRYQAGYKKGYTDALASRPQEQEQVTWSYKYHCFICSNCGLGIEDEVHYMMNKPINFCPTCGRKVKWDA